MPFSLEQAFTWSLGPWWAGTGGEKKALSACLQAAEQDGGWSGI